MAWQPHDNLHSRLVAVLKVALPLVALAILSSLFMLSGPIDPEDAIPYAEVDVAARLREPRMTDAGFAGVTADGASLMLSAAEARPGAGGGNAKIVLGTLQTSDGGVTELAAAAVQLDAAANMIELSEGVEMRSSAGYVISAPGMGVATDRTYAESRGAVSAVGPMGQLTADHMELSAQEGVPDSYVLVFNGKVRLLYMPDR
jgi:lipopolysaccharide export system protein LptC